MALNFSAASLTRVVTSCLLLAGALYLVSTPFGSNPPAALLLDPWDGLYRNARVADSRGSEEVRIPFLSRPVQMALDARGVPHIYADSDRDAIIALGYQVAKDRLFQLDYIPRVAAGRLSEAFGPDLVPTDQFLRNTGMLESAIRNAARIEEEGGREYSIAQWFANGVNTYIDSLDENDLPLEFRLLGYKPDRYTVLHQTLLLQFMIFDLTFETDSEEYGPILDAVGADEFRKLFPEYNYLSIPIISDPSSNARASNYPDQVREGATGIRIPENLSSHFGGYIDGKGSNNWAVSGSRSETGYPILAGDMHLGLTLPAIWYEVHIVTPTMNTYGVTIPGSPVPVEAFNEYVAWAFTNTATDQIDFHALQLDPLGEKYLFEDEYLPFDMHIDTIRVKGEPAVIDTVLYTEWGPVFDGAEGYYAMQWVGHESNRNIEALWRMNHATDLYSFQDALRTWDAPMQNILVADTRGDIAIRSTGFLPLRGDRSEPGFGLNRTGSPPWSGRVPFDELPYSQNPRSGFLTSTNQQPAGRWYSHYQGGDWRATFRSIRIDELLNEKEFHSVRDLMSYQADVHAVQHDLLRPVIESADATSSDGQEVRRDLLQFDGEMTTDSRRAIVFDTWFTTLRSMFWDEAEFSDRKPSDGTMVYYLTDVERSPWFDIMDTDEEEGKSDLLRESFERTAVTLESFYGASSGARVWGDVHRVTFRHLTRSESLRSLWRGPYPFGGFSETLSPGAGRNVNHSASWRMVVDLQPDGPVGYGVYPGGQSGRPFSRNYDSGISTYLDFDYFTLQNPRNLADLDSTTVSIQQLIP